MDEYHIGMARCILCGIEYENIIDVENAPLCLACFLQEEEAYT
jgi:hypothetical protein